MMESCCISPCHVGLEHHPAHPDHCMMPSLPKVGQKPMDDSSIVVGDDSSSRTIPSFLLLRQLPVRRLGNHFTLLVKNNIHVVYSIRYSFTSSYGVEAKERR
jgi:hypothetical protein